MNGEIVTLRLGVTLKTFVKNQILNLILTAYRQSYKEMNDEAFKMGGTLLEVYDEIIHGIDDEDHIAISRDALLFLKETLETLKTELYDKIDSFETDRANSEKLLKYMNRLSDIQHDCSRIEEAIDKIILTVRRRTN